jgi:hypothetical protein
MSSQTTEIVPETSDSPKNDSSPADGHAMKADPRDDQDDSLSWVDESSSDEPPADEFATIANPPEDEDSPKYTTRADDIGRDESLPDYTPGMLGLNVNDLNPEHAPEPAGHTNLPTSANVTNTPLPPTAQEDADFLLAQQLQAEFDAESAQSFRVEEPLANAYSVNENVEIGQEILDKGSKTLKDI